LTKEGINNSHFKKGVQVVLGGMVMVFGQAEEGSHKSGGRVGPVVHID